MGEAIKSWDNLKQEIDMAEEAGRFLPLWWRDDDAIQKTPALSRLYTYRVPLVLAVIPALLKQDLPMISGIKIAQHGYDHHNRASQGEKKNEFPLDRNEDEIIQTLQEGRKILTHTFGHDFLPLFVPPWNRFSHSHLLWQKAGLKRISAYSNPLIPQQPGGEPYRLDTHIDLINWHKRSFIGEKAVLDGLCAHLRQKRSGLADRLQPTGFLSHHLVHDRETWSFLDKWTNFLENEKNRIGWILPEID